MTKTRQTIEAEHKAKGLDFCGCMLDFPDSQWHIDHMSESDKLLHTVGIKLSKDTK